jgi:hypothetical protein
MSTSGGTLAGLRVPLGYDVCVVRDVRGIRCSSVVVN